MRLLRGYCLARRAQGTTVHPFVPVLLVALNYTCIAELLWWSRALAVWCLQVLNLLLDMPGGFAEVLLEHACLPRILQLVELQLVRQAFEEG